ncbi:Leucine Rich Repeat family protein [Leishmania donovani]|uniref:Leucine Rich Repeat family protein n=1 Tax=Leishmania donovani TaxID=5661 RepID=A0A504X9D0_LEIDO|nr:Leucine Rich Repeat family protein [Leishmania donovani]
MDLDFSNRGLFAFDAAKARSALVEASLAAPRTALSTTSTDGGDAAGAAPPLSALPAIRLLNLSYNSLHLFTGGETLKGLTVLDLSHNALTQLHSQSMPPTLVRLSIAHNQLAHLCDLAKYTPRLQVLEAGHNHLSTSALRGLPASLTHLSVENNTIESLVPLGSLLHLTHLNLAQNQLESRDTLCALRPLVSLRHLDVRGNPMYETGRRSSEGEDEGVTQLLHDVLPRLSRFNGTSLSQAPENRIQQQRLHEPALEVRLMQAKVNELRRLLLASQDAEGKARQKRALLIENVKSTAKVIGQQETELERLQSEVDSLRSVNQKLQSSVAAAEQSFEHVHASLLVSKAKLSAAEVK